MGIPLSNWTFTYLISLVKHVTFFQICNKQKVNKSEGNVIYVNRAEIHLALLSHISLIEEFFVELLPCKQHTIFVAYLIKILYLSGRNEKGRQQNNEVKRAFVMTKEYVWS